MCERKSNYVSDLYRHLTEGDYGSGRWRRHRTAETVTSEKRIQSLACLAVGMMFAENSNVVIFQPMNQDHIPRKWSTTSTKPTMNQQDALKVFLQHRIRTVISKEWWDFVVNVNNMNSDHASLLYSVANLCPSFQHFLKSRDKEISYVLRKRPVINPRIFSGSERMDVQPLTFPTPPKEMPPPKKSCSSELDKILNELYPNDKSIFKRKQRLSGPASRQRKTPAIKFKSAYPPKESSIEHTENSSTLLAKLLREDNSSVTALTANNRLAPPKQNTSFRSPASISSKENKNHKVEYAVSDYDFNRNKVSMNIKKIKKIIKVKRKRYFYTDKSSPIRYNLEDETPELKLELIKRYKIKKCSIKLEKLTPNQIKKATRPRSIISNGLEVITSSDVCRSDDKASAPPQTMNGEHDPSTSHRPWEDHAVPPENVKNTLEERHIASQLNHEISRSDDKISVLPQTMNFEHKPSTSHRPWVDEAISAEHVANNLEEKHIPSEPNQNICRSDDKMSVLPETMNCEQKPSKSHKQLPGNEAITPDIVKNNLEERQISFQPNQDISKSDDGTSALPQTVNGEHKPSASHRPLSGDEAISQELHKSTLKEKCDDPQPNSDICGSNDKTSVLPQTVNGEHKASTSPTPLEGKEAILSKLVKNTLKEEHVAPQPNHDISVGKANALPQTENDDHKPPTSYKTLADNATVLPELVKNTLEEKHNISTQPSPNNLLSYCTSIIPKKGTAEGNIPSMQSRTSESGSEDLNCSAVIKYSDQKENVEVADHCKPKDLIMDIKTVYCHGGIVPIGKKVASNEKPFEKFKHFLSLKEKKIKDSLSESRDPVSPLKQKSDHSAVNVGPKSDDVPTTPLLKSGDKSNETFTATPEKCITDAELSQGKCASVLDSSVDSQSLEKLSEKEEICVSVPVSQDDSRIEEAEDMMEDSLVNNKSPKKQDLNLEYGLLDPEGNESNKDVELNKCSLLEDRTSNTRFEEGLKEPLENTIKSHEDHTESQDHTVSQDHSELPQEVYTASQDDHIESQDETDSEEDEVRSPYHTELDVDHSRSLEDHTGLEEDQTGLQENHTGPHKEPMELQETIAKDSAHEMELNLTESTPERSEASKKNTDSGICDMGVSSPSTETLMNGEPSSEKESLSELINTDEPQNDDELLSEPLAKRPRIEVNLTEMKIELTKPSSKTDNLKNDFSCRLCKQTFYSLIDWLSHFDNEVPKCTPNLNETCDRPEVPMLN